MNRSLRAQNGRFLGSVATNERYRYFRTKATNRLLSNFRKEVDQIKRERMLNDYKRVLPTPC